VHILAIMSPRIALFLLVDSGQRKDDIRGLSGPVCLALTERLQIEDFFAPACDSPKICRCAFTYTIQYRPGRLSCTIFHAISSYCRNSQYNSMETVAIYISCYTGRPDGHRKQDQQCHHPQSVRFCDPLGAPIASISSDP